MKTKKIKVNSVSKWIFSYKNPVYRLFSELRFHYRNLRFSVINFLNPLYPKWRSTLPKHKNSDISYVIVESNFNLLLDFHDHINKNNWVDWESDEQLKKFYDELEKNIFWLKNERENLSKLIEKEFFKVSSDYTTSSTLDKYQKVSELEKEKQQKETEILTWMIQNRSFFWT